MEGLREYQLQWENLQNTDTTNFMCVTRAQSSSRFKMLYTPFRREPVDGTLFLHFDTYNNILGYGKAMGVIISKPDRENPEKYRAVVRVVFTFSGN